MKKYLDKYEEAIDLYTRTLQVYISETEEDSEETANAYHNLGDTYWDLGNIEAAIAFEKKALKNYQELYGTGSRVCEEFYERLGLLCYNDNNFDEAISFIDKAYHIVKEKEIPIGQGYYLHKLGMIFAKNGDIDRAIKAFEEAIRLLPEDHQEAIDSQERLKAL